MGILSAIERGDMDLAETRKFEHPNPIRDDLDFSAPRPHERGLAGSGD